MGLTFFIYWKQMNLTPYPWLIISLFLRLSEKSENHLILCLFEGALVVAPTGSGKTTAIAIPNLLEWTGSGV